MDSAFTEPISLPSSTPDPQAAQPPPQAPAPTDSSTLSVSTTEPTPANASSGDSWRVQYDAYVTEWRAASALAREKAEGTREMFESVRAREEAEAASQKQDGKGKGKEEWEDVHPGRQPLPKPSPSPADGRDLVTGERQGHNNHGQAPSGSSPPISISHWEDVPSVASSFPSLPSQQTSPPSRHRPSQNTDSHPASSSPEESSPEDKDSLPAKASKDATASPSKSRAIATSSNARAEPPAVTPLILDVTLPLKTRALALLSSLAINMFLPFVNGVMLGFGEVFARNVIAPWLGWQGVIKPTAIPTLRPKVVSEAERQALHRREQLRSTGVEL